MTQHELHQRLLRNANDARAPSQWGLSLLEEVLGQPPEPEPRGVALIEAVLAGGA